MTRQFTTDRSLDNKRRDIAPVTVLCLSYEIGQEEIRSESTTYNQRSSDSLCRESGGTYRSVDFDRIGSVWYCHKNGFALYRFEVHCFEDRKGEAVTLIKEAIQEYIYPMLTTIEKPKP